MKSASLHPFLSGTYTGRLAHGAYAFSKGFVLSIIPHFEHLATGGPQIPLPKITTTAKKASLIFGASIMTECLFSFFTNKLYEIPVLTFNAQALRTHAEIGEMLPMAKSIETIQPTSDAHHRAEIEQYKKLVGPELSEVAKNTKNLFQKVEIKEPSSKIDYHLKSILSYIFSSNVDIELAVLKYSDLFLCTIEKIPPKKLLDIFTIAADFLKQYRAVYSKIGDKHFNTKEEEAIQWQNGMGLFWHPLFNPANNTLEKKHAAFHAWASSSIDKIETIINKRRIITPQETVTFGLKECLKYDIEDKKKKIKQFIYNIEYPSFFYRTLYRFFDRTPSLTHLPNDTILVEVVEDKKIIYHVSENLKQKGISIGMSAEHVLEAYPEIRILPPKENTTGKMPLSYLITKFFRFNYFHSNKGRLHSLLFAFLLSPITAWQWVFNIPTWEKISEEIGKNALKHMYNPAFKSLIFLLIDELLNRLVEEEKPLSKRAPLGETVVETSMLLKDLSPSLKSLNLTLKVMGLSARVFAGASLFLIYNPVFEKLSSMFSKKENKETIQKIFYEVKNTYQALFGVKPLIQAAKSFVSFNAILASQNHQTPKNHSHIENLPLSMAHIIQAQFLESLREDSYKRMKRQHPNKFRFSDDYLKELQQLNQQYNQKKESIQNNILFQKNPEELLEPIRKDIDRLQTFEASLPLYYDPVWWMEREGQQLIPHAKKITAHFCKSILAIY